MTYAIVFMHYNEGEPAIRIVRGTREEADLACEKVKAIYEDELARVVEISDTHDDLDQINDDFEDNPS